MALTIENGTSVVGANSYIDVAYATNYALDRGVILPAEGAEAKLIRAADYLETFAKEYTGFRATARQGLSWPRRDAVIYGEAFEDDQIPERLKQAQAEGVIQIVNGIELMPTLTGYAVRREKVDVVEIEYATGGASGTASATKQFSPEFPKIDALLAPLFGDSYTSGFLQTVRA